MRNWLLLSVVVALLGGCADFGRSTTSRPRYVSYVSPKATVPTKSTKAKAASGQASAQPSTEDSPYGNSGILKPGRTEPVVQLDK
jgi:hypothetical protein